MKTKLTFLTLFVFSAMTLVTSQIIDKQVIESSGSTSSNTTNSLTATIGEPVFCIIESGASINQAFLAGAAVGSTLSMNEQWSTLQLKYIPIL